MSRLDRRGRDPHPGDLRDLQAADIANRTIIPQTRNGVLRTGKEDIAMNRAYQAFGDPKIMQQFVNRYVFSGGTSPLWGKNPKAEGSAPDVPTIPEDTWIASYNASTLFTLPVLSVGVYDFTVFWGDGTSDVITAWDQVEVTHAYGLAGQYYIVIVGQFEGIGWNEGADPNSLLEVLYFGTGFKLGDGIIGSEGRQFANCINLTSIHEESLNTSGVEWMTNMFENSGITSINMTSWDLTSVISLTSLFNSCLSLVDINAENLISPTNTPTITSVRNMFSKCNALSSLNIDGWDVSNISEFNNTFNGCSVLAEMNVDGWITATTTVININIGYMFKECHLISDTTLGYISNWDIAKVTTIDNIFQNNNGIVTIDLSGWDVSQVSSMRAVFQGCSNLTTPILTGWVLPFEADLLDFFNACTSLTAINLNSWDVSQALALSGFFGGCTSLVTVEINQWDLSGIDFNMLGFLTVVPISVASYDALLDINTGWTSKIGVKIISFTANIAQYTSGGDAELGRADLVSKGWRITDAGPVVP